MQDEKNFNLKGNPEVFGRGSIEEVKNRLLYFKKMHDMPFDHSGVENLEKIISDGYTFVLCLPRLNTAALVKKYGPYFDKLKAYHDFFEELSFRSVGYKPAHTQNNLYFFKTREDAEKAKEFLEIVLRNSELPLPTKGFWNKRGT